MDEQKVKEIYKELYEQFKKIKAEVKLRKINVPNELSDELNEMKALLSKLKEKAAEANIYVDEEEDVDYTEDSSDDWEQIVDCSESHEGIKETLKKHIRSLGEFPSAKQTLDMVTLIDRYYDTNVTNITGKRVNEIYEQKFGKPSDMDEAASVAKYRKAAYAATQKGIKSITINWTIQPKAHFHIPFDGYYMNKEALPKEVAEMDVPLQFKFDIGTKKWGTTKTLGFLKFGEPTVQLSFKFSFFKDAHLIRTSNEEIFGTCIESYSQAIRSTITLEGISKGFRPKKGSTTTYSNGLLIPFPEYGGNLVLKMDLGTFDWAEVAKKSLKPSLGAVRVQGNFNPLKFGPIGDLLPAGVTLDRAIVTLAFGFNLSLDPFKLDDFVDLKFKKKPKLDKVAKKITEMDADDVKKLKSLQDKALKLEDKALKLEDKAEKLGKLFKDQKPSKDDVKKAAQVFKESVDDLYKNSQELMKKSKAAQEAVEELLEKTAKKITEKIGAKALTALGKVVVKGIPIVGAVITFVEVVTMAYNIYKYFNESELPWEEEVAKWLRSWSK
jgi:hypothetical protein